MFVAQCACGGCGGAALLHRSKEAMSQYSMSSPWTHLVATLEGTRCAGVPAWQLWHNFFTFCIQFPRVIPSYPGSRYPLKVPRGTRS
eukprot:13054416-Alexandrium_andersonii.AAC.1